MITPSRTAWPPETVMVRMETDPSHSTAWINTLCVPVEVFSWAEICLFRQSVAGPAVSTLFFFFFYELKQPPDRSCTQILTLASEVAKLAGGHVKAGATYVGRNSPCSCPRHPLVLWPLKQRCHSGIFNQYQMLLSDRKESGKKWRKGRDGCLLKNYPHHCQANQTPNVRDVYFYPLWRKRQSHNFPCSVSDQHKHARAQVHFYPLEKFSLIRADTLLSHSNINVHAHNLINPLLLIFAACSGLQKKKIKTQWERLNFTIFRADFTFLLFFFFFFYHKNDKWLSCFSRKSTA